MAAADRLYVELVANVGGFVTGMDRSAKAVGRLDASTGKADKALSRLKKGSLLALATGTALVVRETVKLDTAMRNVNSISGMTETALAATTDQLVKMSTTLPQSASTLAEGLYDISSSGFQGAAAMKVLNAAAMSASAGMTDTAVSAKAITAVLNAYKLPASEAADVSDILFSVVDKGVISFEELSGVVGNYVGTAEAVGVSFAETGSAIATMTLNGIGAAEAGTSLNAVLQEMIKPGEGLRSTMKGLGYESGTAMVEALGFRGALLAIAEASGGTAEGLSENFNNIRSLRGALALTNNEGAKWNELGEKIEDSTGRAGAAQKALAEQSKAASFQLGLLRNRAMGAGVGLANMALPLVVDGLREVGELGEDAGRGLQQLGDMAGPALENLADIGEDLWQILTDVAEAFGPIAATMAGAGIVVAVEAFELLTDVLGPLVGILADVSGAIADNEVAAGLLTAALGLYLVGGVKALTVKLQVALVTALYNTLTAMGALTGGTVALSAALTRLMGSAAGVATVTAGLVIGVDALSKAIVGPAPSVDQLTAALVRFSETGEVAGALAQVVGINFDDLAETLDRASQSKWFSLDWGTSHNDIREAEQNVDALDETLASLVRGGHGEIAAKTFARIGAEASHLSDAELAKEFDSYSAALDGVEASSALAAAETEDLAGEQDVLRDAVETATEALTAQADALRAQFDPLFAVRKATQAHAEAQAEVAKAIKEHGKGSDEARLAQWALLESTVDVAEASDRLMAAVEAGTVSVGASKEQLNRWVAQGLLTQGQADELAAGLQAVATRADEISDTPASLRVTDNGSTAPVLSALRLAKERLEDLNGRTAVVTTLYRSVGAPGAAPVSRTVGVGGGLREGGGGLLDFYASGGLRENHVAQIAPAGAWRVWAEEETGGEAYIPLSPAKRKRSIDIWRETGRRLDMYAKGDIHGGAVGPGGSSLTTATRGLDIPSIEAVVRSWEAYNVQLEEAERRHYLVRDAAAAARQLAGAVGAEAVAEAKERVAATSTALRDFDFAHARRLESEAVERQVAALENLARAEEEAAEAARAANALRVEQQDNKFELGVMSAAEYLDVLRRRMDDEVRFSDAWTALYQERQQILQEHADAQRELHEQMSQAARDALDEAMSARDSGFARLDSMLDEVEDIQARIGQSRTRFAEEQGELRRQAAESQDRYEQQQLDASRAYLDQVEQLMDARQTAILSGLRADQRMTSSWGNSVDMLGGNVQQQADAIGEWARELTAARARGVSEEVIAALGLDKGPEALGQLKQFTTATVDEIDTLNRAVAARTAAAETVATAERKQMLGRLGVDLQTAHDRHTKALSGFTEEYLREQEQIAGDLALLQADFIVEQEALTVELEQVGTDQGRTFGDAVAAGLASAIPAVRAAANKLTALLGEVADAEQALAVVETSTPTTATSSGGVLDSPFRRRGLRTATYDVGGWLQPGYTLAYNGTGAPERVVGPGGAAGGGGVGDITVRVFVGDRELTDIVDVRIDSTLGGRRTSSTIAGSR